MDQIDRSEVVRLREALGRLGTVIAEVDRDLRYVWITNSHPDFDPTRVIGRRDEELAGSDAEDLAALKRQVFQTGKASACVLKFHLSDGILCYSISAFPIRESDGRCERLLTIGFDSSAKALEKVRNANSR